VADAAAPLDDGQDVTSGVLYRRILPHRDYYKAPPENRATSLNFLNDRGEDSLSTFRAAETTPSEVLEGHDGFGLLEIGAEILWGLGLRVIYTPRWGKGHVSVYGFTKQDGQARRNAAIASRVIIPPVLPA
jgi:hypothetical protein